MLCMTTEFGFLFGKTDLLQARSLDIYSTSVYCLSQEHIQRGSAQVAKPTL